MLKRKGMSTVEAMIVFVLVIATIFLIFTFAGKVRVVLADWSASSLCRISASGRAATKVAGFETSLIPELECETQYYYVDAEGIRKSKGPGSRGYETITRFQKGKAQEAEEQIKKLFAESLRSCWKDLGEGTLDPFGDYTEASRCVPCSEVYFERDSLKKLLGKERIDGLTDYLAKTPIPASEQAAEEVSYLKYLTAGARDVDSSQAAKESISLQKHYTVLYRSDRSVNLQNTGTITAAGISLVVGGKAGCAVGGLIGTAILPVVGSVAGCAAGGGLGAVAGSGGALLAGVVLLKDTRKPRILYSTYVETGEITNYCEALY